MDSRSLFLTMAILFSGSFLIAGCTKSQTSDSVKEAAHAHKEIYTCPMHPEIRQDHPGNCPICNMKLVKVEEESKKDSKTEKGPSDVKLRISPYQAELVGIEPLSLSRKDVTYQIPVSGRILSQNSVALQVFEKDFRFVKSGVRFSGFTDVYPDKEIIGKIVSIDSLVDPTSRTIRVVGRIHEGPSQVLMESTFSGKIEVDLGKQLILPEKAILFTGKGSYAYLYNGETLQPRQIFLGPKVSGGYVLLKGLSEGDKVSSGPNFLIDSESKIRGLND